MKAQIMKNDRHPHHIDCFAPAKDIHEAIARRAYEIYCARTPSEGHALDDWLQAEEQVLGRKHEQQANTH